MGRPRQGLVARFTARTRKTRGCWLWRGPPSGRKGYGRMEVDGRSMYAHRLSYLLWVGGIPRRLGVLHTCDTPLCVNPKHLFLGTNLDNARDRCAKGRQGVRLTPPIVRRIRRALRAGNTHKTIATIVGTSRWAVRDIAQNKTWQAVR